MAVKGNGVNLRTRSPIFMFTVITLCCFFYILGAWQRSGFGKGDSIAERITKQTDCAISPNLVYDTHHDREDADDLSSRYEIFESCRGHYTDYTPCQDQNRELAFPKDNMIHKERHCPSEEEKLHCLIPAPEGYVVPFQWPKSREFVPFANVPYKTLTVNKAVESWVHYEGNFFRFPGGGTQFPQGADAYIDQLASFIPIGNGTVRTALDIGCGVASWGAYLFERNVLTMSFAPKDVNEAQVQFALERGVPAVIGVVGTIKLPYPSRSFDMAHCSSCSVPWTANDGMYMMEVDRVLKPGGYWILSGPPVDWKIKHKQWQVNEKNLEEEKKSIEKIASMLCWEKVSEKDEVVIWRKKPVGGSCPGMQDETRVRTCDPSYADDVWCKKMDTCMVPFLKVSNPEEVAGEVRLFPERLNDVPPRIATGLVPGFTSLSYQEDIRLWKKHVKAYKRINKYLDNGRYRNIMDMNAGLGSFAAAIESSKLWVMNVVPIITEKSTLGAIYERGLIGIYHDWCEAFSTYPRTYDLIHANGVFSLYKDKCRMEDILLEMDRILRPEGAVIFRDDVDILKKVKRIARGMRWKTKMVDHEDGPLLTEKILFAVKQYWVGVDNGKAAEV